MFTGGPSARPFPTTRVLAARGNSARHADCNSPLQSRLRAMWPLAQARHSARNSLPHWPPTRFAAVSPRHCSGQRAAVSVAACCCCFATHSLIGFSRKFIHAPPSRSGQAAPQQFDKEIGIGPSGAQRSADAYPSHSMREASRKGATSSLYRHHLRTATSPRQSAVAD